MDIRRSADCGNSPKNAFAERVAISWLSGDPRLADYLTDQAVLEVGGGEPVHGRDAIVRLAVGMPRPDELIVEMAVTHGRDGAVSALLRQAGERRGVCLTMKFATVKANQVQSIKVYAL